MSDPLTIDGSRALDASSMVDRDAKIEQLLLAGLDHYFAAQYEQAINVWTRALFLDRSHARARAYIERARSALAERQRESEELLQHGVAAFQRGEGGEARRLLQAAIAGGAPADEALAVLDRLDRLDAAAFALPGRELRASAPSPSDPIARRSSRVALLTVAGIAVLLAAGAVYEVVGRGRADWRALRQAIDPPITGAMPFSEAARERALPLPQRGETALVRARALVASGHMRDALTALDAVRSTDAQRADADRLRADIQRRLLELGAARRTP